MSNELIEQAARRMDWRQVVLNGGPPCFYLEHGQVRRFCGRAERWQGHGDAHTFVSLADLLARALPPVAPASGERLFPIQQSSPIPWVLAERAYDTYAHFYGTDQSLKRLAERGGFGLQEFACLFNGHRPEGNHQGCVDRADSVGRRLASLETELATLKEGPQEGSWEWARAQMKAGKAVTRSTLVEGCALSISGDGFIDDHSPVAAEFDTESFLFTMEDFEATDWQIAAEPASTEEE